MPHLLEKDYTVKELLTTLNNEAKEAVKYIDQTIKDYDHTTHTNEYFSDVYLFEEEDFPDNPTGALRKATWGRRGIYVFVVKEDFTLTREDVRNYNKCEGAGFNHCHEVDLKNGEHFYQGSTIKSLLTRLKAHYSNISDVSAIQLNNGYRLIVKNKLKLYIFPMVPPLADEPFFIKMIEAELHDRFPAITGNKRV